jgi:CMP-N-acetylneuraminic acid synthetase
MSASAPAPAIPSAIAVIPARGGSTRLPRKNACRILGVPLLGWVARAALGSEYLGPGRVFVSTDDDEIAQLAIEHGAAAIARPAELADNFTWTEPVIRHAVRHVERSGSPVDLVVWLNASIPEVQTADIDRAIQKLRADNLREVFAVDAHDRCTSAVRVLKREALDQAALSVNAGIVRLDYIDVHYPDDLKLVEERLVRRAALASRPMIGDLGHDAR